MQTAQIKNKSISGYLHMINDRWRNSFFQQALIKHAKDKVVLDMGSGTGILSFYALSAGAKFVYAIEGNPNSSLITEKVLSRHFDRKKFKVINSYFWTDEISDIEIDQKIDILVTETVGPGLFDQGMFHTWHCIKPFLSEQAISIPDRLHLDAWIWNDNKCNFNYESPTLDLHCSELLDDNFAKCLIQADHDMNDFSPMDWANINTIQQTPSKIYENVLTYSMHKLPNLLFSDQHYPRHIIPNISFDIDIDEPSKVGIIGKISFENETLFIKDALYMPWKFNPIFFINQTGRYTFTYNNFDLIHMFKNEWLHKLDK